MMSHNGSRLAAAAVVTAVAVTMGACASGDPRVSRPLAPSDTVGGPGARQLEAAQVRPATTPEENSPSATARRRSDAASERPGRQGRTAQSQRRAFAPTSITLEPGDHRASVLAVDTENDGLALPADAGQVGWWRSGAQAGDLFGTVVLAGHIDAATTGIGFFARLLRSQVGDTLTLEGGDGARHRYRVTTVRDLPKADLVGTRIFTTDGPAQLALVTCSGTFDPRTQHYDQNRVVLATPLD